ncbi:MAG: hypothetical protein ACP5RD_03755 [bacterium]|jgi:hypothetical protein
MEKNYSTDNFVLLIQQLKEPFDKLNPIMSHANFFNLMKINFELLADQVASRYLKDRAAYSGQLPIELEQQYCKILIDSLSEGNLKVLDYIKWLDQVIWALENEQDIPVLPEELFMWEQFNT